ncbi:MAG: MerR family transcriptional regulator [Lachnospiraceae bacterium]|nr:MerR family transcriptional regulator [Lachnospiraceae bacterium]
MLYKIGTIAEVLGMPVHVVRFYEEKGLLKAKHIDGSTTRYFDEYE